MSWVRQRTDFDIDQFNRIVVQKGYVVQWEKATKCPCMQIGGSGQPDYNCPVCMGKGWTWFDPKFIQGIMTALTRDYKYENPGERGEGTSSFTTLAYNTLGYYDRITHLDSLARHSELIRKGFHNGKDKIRFQPMDIIYCRDLDREYVEEVDFTYDVNSFEIQWIPGGKEPNTGTTYSVEYLTHPRWIVKEMPNIMRDTYVKRKKPNPTFIQLPIRAVVQLEWFVFGVVDP
jgi:hypothetical protein